MSIHEELARLRWSCRRGMLELDLLLGQFLAKGFLTLTAEDQILFKSLLNYPDQDLFNWLLGEVPPPDLQFLPLLKQIKTYA